MYGYHMQACTDKSFQIDFGLQDISGLLFSTN